MALVQISKVFRHELPTDQLVGAHLEHPEPGTASETYSFAVEGWVLSKTAPVAHLEVLREGRPVARFPASFNRPDLARAFPKAASTDRSGFRASIGTLRLPTRFDVLLRVRLDNGALMPLA